VLNSFQVLEQSGEPINDLDREMHICRTLRNNLSKQNVKEQPNILRQSRQAKHFPINNKIRFHKDPLSRYTIVEIITTDHAGLLASIGRAFIDLGVQLHDAKITTIGSRVEDMFSITDQQFRPINDEKVLANIQEVLLSILEDKDD
jgi:[protein-PII] uridylyltransferase